MRTVKVAFTLSVLLVVAYVLWTATDTILWFVQQAGELTLLSIRVCGSLLVFVVAVACLWLLLRQQYERNRQRDGAFALREYWLEPWPRRLSNWLRGRPSARVILDMNANISHAAIVHDAVYAVEPAAGWERQLRYMENIERTRRAQAIAPGDGVLGLPWFSSGSGRSGVANAATGRLLAGAYDKQQKPAIVEQPPPPAAPMLPPPALTARDAVAQSTPTAIVMGQTDNGAPVCWDLLRTPHLRFHGMTQGSGKTNAIQTIAAGALVTGSHVVVCDRVQFKDWSDFDGHAEFVDTSDPQALADVAARLYNIYLGRTRQLARSGAKNISRLAQPPQRIIVVLSEFGAQMASARAVNAARAVEYPLTQLARLAAAAGIHLVAEDQTVNAWPRELIANLVPAIGRMPAHAGQACGYQGQGGGTDTFPSYTFWCEGNLFRTPHMEPALPSLLAPVPAPARLVMLTPPWQEAGSSSQPVHEPVHESVHDEFTGSSPLDSPPPPHP